MELLNQGTYGCIFRPGITCSEKPQSPKYTTKIHVNNTSRSVDANEAAIGELIRTKISNYGNYFSPVLETCSVDLAKVNKDDIDQCEFINKDIMSNKPLEYVSSKLKYIEGTTLDKYVSKHRSPEIVEHIYKYLMNSVAKLASIGIVHFDIKENNIIVKNNGTPILIDFGISIQPAKLMDKKLSDLKPYFYVHAPNYEPWSPEINIISYYVHNPNIKKVTKSKILEIGNTALAAKYDGQPSIQVVRDLMKSYKTWDEYAVKRMISELIYKYNISPTASLKSLLQGN